MRSIVAVLTAVAALVAAQAGRAQTISPAEKSLAECVRLKSTGQDRLTLGRWFVATMGSAPQVSDVAKIDPAVRATLNRQFAATFTRLVVSDCLTETKALGPTRDSKAFELVGRVLGELAVQEILTNPDATAALDGFTEYLKEEDFAVLKR